MRQETYNDAPAETVLGQAPVAGTSVPKGSAVTLTVSVGPQPFAMPNVAGGATCAAAKAQLEALGLVVTVKSPSGTCTTNPVLLQNPPAGPPVRRQDPQDSAPAAAPGGTRGPGRRRRTRPDAR